MKKLRIDEMFAFIVQDDNGDEGICGFKSPIGWMPMVGADMKRMESLMPMARELSLSTPNPIKLVKFNVRQELETIG